MAELGWYEAILAVLSSGEALHYADIAEQIAQRKLKSTSGATPASTVNSYLSTSIAAGGSASPFERISRGVYRLRSSAAGSDRTAHVAIPPAESLPAPGTNAEVSEEPAGLINALGMYWVRSRVIWDGVPRLLGRQPTGSESVDFAEQRGVYLLYDRDQVIYVGRTTDRGLGQRLKEHTSDRLNGRWDRFSWFGVRRVSEHGQLEKESDTFNLQMLIATMEALLIESVEPTQNRRRGDDFKAVEFLQVRDPKIEQNEKLTLLGELVRRLEVK